MPGIDVRGLLEPTLNAVRKAGELIIQAADKPRKITHKGRIDLVTETDLAVEMELKKSLGRILPEASFLAEETAKDTAPGELCWIIDPLDGTTNFAHGLPMHATSVALWSGGRIELGIIYISALDEMFHAVRGDGAFLNGRPVAVTGTDDLEQALVATGFPYAIRENIREISDTLENVLIRSRGVRRMGSAAVDLAYVAAGRQDAFYEILLNPWDVAAGWLLVEEAGGRVTTFDPARDYHLGSRTILATNKALHDEVAGLMPQGAGQARSEGGTA